MSEMIAWIAAEAEPTENERGAGFPAPRRPREAKPVIPLEGLAAHQFPASGLEKESEGMADEVPLAKSEVANEIQVEVESPEEQRLRLAELRLSDEEDERKRRIYRGRVVTMLRRYLRYSIETGRLPSMLGAEFFRAKVTAYTVVTFEDRAIFVHDMETCLSRLDEFSQQLIARHILQEHDQLATSRLLHCSERTVRTYVPVALDLLTEILLEVGLMQRAFSIRENSCQGGKNGPFSASDCEQDE